MLTFLLAATLRTQKPPIAPRASAADQAAFVRWLGSGAHSFGSEIPTAEQMAGLVSRLAGAQIVGEATHGTHEDQAFKAELIKALVLSGRASVFALESNRQVGVDLDRFIHGEGGDLPVILRSPSFFRIWRTDEFAGLMLWLRAYNVQAAHPVSVVGIDVQDPGVDAEVALRFVAARDAEAAARLGTAFEGLRPGPKAERYSIWSAKASKEVYTAAANSAKELAELFETHRSEWANDVAYAEAAYAARTARQAFEIFELENGRGNPEKAGPSYYSRRDRFMADNLLERLHGRTAAFWAHDGHVIGDDGSTDGYTWVGRELHQRLQSRYQTVTFAWSRGSFRAQTLGGSLPDGVLHRRPLVPQT